VLTVFALLFWSSSVEGLELLVVGEAITALVHLPNGGLVVTDPKKRLVPLDNRCLPVLHCLIRDFLVVLYPCAEIRVLSFQIHDNVWTGARSVDHRIPAATTKTHLIL
jgi:hypothetical protein